MSKKAKTWFSIKNEAAAPAAEISIYEEIGSWGVTAKAFATQLGSIPKERNIDVLLNSPGGQVWDALAIYNLLNSRREKVTMRIHGIAASSASIVAMAGSKCIMPRNAMMMIHNPAGTIFDGKSDEMRKYADLLDKVRDQLAGIYADESGMDEDEAKELMEEESWLTAEEAMEKGLCDEISEPITVTAKFDLHRFSKVPTNLAGAGGQPANPPKEEPKKITMNKIIAALVAAGIAVPETATEDQIVAKFNEAFAGIKTERDQLKVSNQKEVEARKKRVEARVKTAIEAKKIKAEREASLVALGVADEANLDFLDDIAVAPPTNSGHGQPGQSGQRRGSPPAPSAAGNEDTTEQKIENLRKDLKDEGEKGYSADPIRIANLAKELRKLRGHEDIIQADK